MTEQLRSPLLTSAPQAPVQCEERDEAQTSSTRFNSSVGMYLSISHMEVDLLKMACVANSVVELGFCICDLWREMGILTRLLLASKLITPWILPRLRIRLADRVQQQQMSVQRARMVLLMALFSVLLLGCVGIDYLVLLLPRVHAHPIVEAEPLPELIVAAKDSLHHVQIVFFFIIYYVILWQVETRAGSMLVSLMFIVARATEFPFEGERGDISKISAVTFTFQVSALVLAGAAILQIMTRFHAADAKRQGKLLEQVRAAFHCALRHTICN
jgi:hypothetical protein